MPTDKRAEGTDPLTILASGEIVVEGRMPWSSNGTFLASVSLASVPQTESSLHAIYKPGRFERPLWDFPGGLYRREIAAYQLSQALGWRLVPETILRRDAPLGEGSLQRFVNADFEQHYFSLLEDESLVPQLEKIAAFDLVANNADRKGGHCLIDADRHIWGIDHGLCFHPEPKLRTVMWDFAGERISKKVVEDLAALEDRGLTSELCAVLEADEAYALSSRVRQLISEPRFPEPDSDHPFPWPLV